MLDRTLPPPIVKTSRVSLPKPHQQSLGGDVKWYAINQISQDVVKIEAVAIAGKWHESKPGLAHFAANMLEKGTRYKTATGLADFFERHGASIEINSGSDFLSVSLYVLNRHLKKVLPVFHEVLTQPNFDEGEFALMKTHFVQTLKINKEKTSYLAAKALRKNVFGKDHPYGRPVEEAGINALTTDDLKSFFSDFIHFHKLFTVSNLSFDELAGELSLFGHNHPSASRGNEKTFAYGTPCHEQIEKSSAVQSSIRMGSRVIDRKHEDYFLLLLLNHYLGGFFGSQLMQNLREDKGLTYGVSSSVHTFRHDGLLTIGTDVDKENASVALEQINAELEKLSRGMIDEDDLELGRHHFIGSLQSEMANPFSILGRIKNTVLHELPFNFYEKMADAVDSATLDQLKTVASKHFTKTQFHQVVAG